MTRIRWLAVVCAASLAVVLLSTPLEGARLEGDVAAGRGLFEANCAMCHGGDASGMMGMHPSLRGAVARLSREGVEVTIRQGRATTPPMPAFGDRLDEEQIADLVAYIASLPEGPRNFGPGQPMMGRGMMDRVEGTGVPARHPVLDVLQGVLLAVLIVLASMALWWFAVGSRRRAGGARSELDRRYAAGELSRQEYLQRKADLDT